MRYYLCSAVNDFVGEVTVFRITLSIIINGADVDWAVGVVSMEKCLWMCFSRNNSCESELTQARRCPVITSPGLVYFYLFFACYHCSVMRSTVTTLTCIYMSQKRSELLVMKEESVSYFCELFLSNNVLENQLP